MTTEPTAVPSSTPAPTADDAAATAGRVPPSAAPYGVAPVAAGVPTARRSRRRRLVDAAVVTSALATLPVAAAWNRAEPLPGDTTLIDAVSQLEEAEDETSLRAAAAGLRASTERHHGRAAARVPPATMIPAADVRPAAPAGARLVAPAPAPADLGAGSLGATPADATEEPASPLVEAAAAATASEPTPIARVAAVDLVAPSVDTVVVGFHEAAGGGTETMESLAPLAVELNAKETAVAPDASNEQVAAVMELPTRERGTAASSAVDVAVPAWQDIVAPVTGRVVTASPYTLYGEFADNRVEIEPDGQPGVRVVMLHIGEVEVRPGDRVVAGETVVAGTAKQFPITSQIDRFAEEISGRAHPHVHMEVIRTG